MHDDGAFPRLELAETDLRLIGVLDHMNLRTPIAQLTAGCKAMFILHDVQGFEHSEIAAIRGCSVGNSEPQLFKARLQLRALLQEAGRERTREKRESTQSVFAGVCTRLSQLLGNAGSIERVCDHYDSYGPSAGYSWTTLKKLPQQARIASHWLGRFGVFDRYFF
jgi:hypothetical protein